MGLFGKKNASKPETNEAVQDNVSKVDAKKKKKSELLKVLDESVWESAFEDFKANKQFIMRDEEGNAKYVALLFDTSQPAVGGLAGKEAKKDESKGSIIEAIRTGRIKTYIRNEMLLDDSFIIIPDVETIDNMDEFNLFVAADYILCTIDASGMIATETMRGTDEEDDPEVIVKFNQIKTLISENEDVATLFPRLMNSSQVDSIAQSAPVDNSASYDDASAEDYPEDIEELPDDLDDIPDDIEDDFEDIPAPQAQPQYQQPPMQQQVPPVQQPTQPQYEDNGYQEDMYDGTYDNYDGADDGGYDEYEDITEDVVQDFVVRKFYSDDLGLEVSTQPFDAQFLHGNAYLPFNENRGAGWLNEYLSNIAKDANTRMERMHNENLFRMRERYMRLIQNHCANIARSLDISDDSTQYGKMRFAIEQNKTDNLNMIEESIAEKKDQLETSWNRKLRQIGDEAAAEAMRQYEERYGRTHDNDIFNLESREKDEIERDYQNSLKRMNEDRRAEASKLLDLAVSETLKEMSTLYLRVLRDEKKEYIRLQNEMTRFIDDNRKDEKARIDALAEENRQVKKANEVRRDYTAKIKAMSAEFDMKKTILQADIDRMQREHDAELRNFQSEWDTRLAEEKNKNAELQAQIDDLLSKYADLDEKKSREYESRIKQLEDQNADDLVREGHIIESHKRANTISVFLVVAILIASLGIGFMVGSILNVRKTSQIEQKQIYQQYTPTQSTSVESTTGDNNTTSSADKTDKADKTETQNTTTPTTDKTDKGN